MFQLSSAGLKNINETQFVTIRFNDSEYKLGIIRAQFLSTKIKSDTTEFIIPIAEKNNSFSYVLKLLNGEKLEIPENVKIHVGSIGMFLQNEELINIANTVDLYPSNVISILKQKLEFHLNITREIEYIASHLFEMEESDIKLLDVDTQYLIFNSSSAKIENESWRFGLISEQVRDNGDRFIKLYETVDFTKLLPNEKEEFLNLVPLEKCTPLLYQKLIYGSIKATPDKQEKVEIPKKEEKSLGKTFKNEIDGSLDGIINYLTKKNNGNVAAKKIVDVSSSSQFIHFSPENLVNYDSKNMFQSLNEEGSWVQFDFKNLQIDVSGYTIVTKEGNQNDHHLKSWVLEASNDGNTWTILDEEKNNVDLNGPSHKKTFEVRNHGSYSKFRIRMTSVAHSGYWAFAASAIEFFGNLIE
ncbi:F5/8 type C domain containing protein [Trichomonas vaginalis G3]|uniref:F5/8 type C domain containing protein n=1 Tax=Trichomonas vaginalis (strain ATCC PRA-98 / G3) TaxID=412133 RepID=A2F936_TRIV3|nr:protein ubiquitination [Trichomonas vaginalis G3]EAX98564.1 F5/8 type C domain containing protein [Trichomonas vaginalis G3]KAI5505244.1 protein ubiquitination [Trichomonas vaginalis G3]|eukprot:XP_001311494.1 F5/8 type C domain containing protein [Trichomonas vaginalis G3]